MSTTTDTEGTEDAAQEAAGAPEEAQPTTDPTEAEIDAQEGDESADDDSEKGSKAHRDAARYRTQLRATEAERDALATRLEAMQRAEVTRLAGDRLAVGADVFDVGRAELAELLTEAGEVDTERVAAVAAALVEARPQLARTRFAGSADGGARGLALEPDHDPIREAADVIRGANRRT